MIFIFYVIARWFVWVYYKIFFKVEIFGLENIPKTGGVLLCANHRSNHDSTVLCTHIKRPLHFVTKIESYENKALSAILKLSNTIPVTRNSTDMATFKNVISVLKSGEIVGIFAQGTRMKDEDSKDAKAGVALFALKAEVPVVPIYITSNYKLFSKIKANIGKPICLDEFLGKKIKSEQLSKIAESIMNEIFLLKDA